ncbi:bifunctional ADP-heptose synthase [Xanthocytophaga agilis]|uniref:Bifunctional ADP-heptose synthase n=1 Tax=Xanthocytophaga agilis TaxID=3048010 RepID=A0AAE3UG10_9BACT|nr:bifunctional ADP-heptose synthase [Xanthocytophaga agilis]MDJ1502861.1 bifunctional ADP-heptose synthase [Xanthocytophaga agilis]
MNLSEIFEAFNNLRVLIIGDVMVDSYLWGKVDRISPEAPVPIVSVKKREKRLGGAANVALNVKSLGAEPILCAVIGADPDGQDFLQLLDESNLTREGIVASASRITTIKHRIISGSQQMLRIDSEMENLLLAPEKADLTKKILDLLPDSDVVIFEDYDKGVLDEVLIQEITEAARKLEIPIIVDPKKRNFLHYKHATLFKPNLKELREGLKIDFNVAHRNELEGALDQLKQHLQLEGVLLTLSERGVFIDLDGEKHHIPAHIRQISDVSGAGDTVVSIAALCLALKLPPLVIAELSNLGGGLVCEYAGVVPVDKQKLLEEAIENSIQIKN